MKIGSKPPSLPSFPDVAVTPSPAGPLPVPYANVANGRVPDSFAPGSGVERRYSVQFLKGLEGRLQLAGLGNEFASEMKRQMSTLDRTGVDREGRVVDSLLTGAHPKESMHLYELTSKLSALVTPGGVRAEANRAGSWTIRPADGDSVELEPGGSMRLPDGVTLKATGDTLQASGSFTGKLHAHGAEVAKLLDPATMAVALGLPSVTPMSIDAAKKGAQLLEGVMETGISIASSAITSDLQKSLELTAELKGQLGKLDDSLSGLFTVMTEYQKLSQKEAREDATLARASRQSVMANVGAMINSMAEVRSAITQLSGAKDGQTSMVGLYDSVHRLTIAAKSTLNTVELFGDGLSEVAAGNIGKSASQLEKALGDTLPVMTKFLGDFVGLGGVGAKTGAAIHRVSSEVERMLGNALGTLMSAEKPVRDQLMTILNQVGQSPAPSRKADRAAENAVLLLEIARHADLSGGADKAQLGDQENKQRSETARDAINDVKELADRIRGQARDFVLSPRFR